jgi:spermidine synthase
LTQGDITEQITILPARSVDAILHDPPRFGIAGELYSQAFYDQLARVIRRGGRLFHYTGTPNRLASQRNVPLEDAGVCVTPALPRNSTVMVCWPSETEELPYVLTTIKLPSRGHLNFRNYRHAKSLQAFDFLHGVRSTFSVHSVGLRRTDNYLISLIVRCR